MPETFSYSPQGIATEMLAAPGVIQDATLPLADYAWAPSDTLQRTFRLQYTAVTTAEVWSMAAFYQARAGTWEAFFFPHPVDAATYLVRFDTSMLLDYFTPHYFRSGGDLIITTVRS